MNGGIGELITSMLGGRSYKQLSKDCGGTPTIGRISGMVTDEMGGFPNVSTIKGLSKGLGVSHQAIINACGIDLGLWTPQDLTSSGIPLPRGAEDLNGGQRNAVVAVVREFINSNSSNAA